MTSRLSCSFQLILEYNLFETGIGEPGTHLQLSVVPTALLYDERDQHQISERDTALDRVAGRSTEGSTSLPGARRAR